MKNFILLFISFLIVSTFSNAQKAPTGNPADFKVNFDEYYQF